MSKGKGYLLPLQIAGHELECVTLKIPKNLEYRTAFVGHLLQLGKWWTWEKDGTTRASEAGRMWSDLLLSHLVVGGDCEGGEGVDCCNEISIEINNVRRALSIQQNQWRIDNATAIETQAQEVVGTNYSSSGESPLCTALNFYVKTKMLEALNLKRALAGLARFSNLVLGNGLANFFDGILGGTVFAVSYANAVAYEDAFNDAPTVDGVICEIRSLLTDNAINQANFMASLMGLSLGAGNREIVVSTLQGGASETLNYLYFLECMMRSVPLALSGISVCECGTWSHTFDFTQSASGWRAVFGDRSVYVTGNGWIRSNNIRNRLQIETVNTLSGITITSIVVTMSKQHTLGSGGYAGVQPENLKYTSGQLIPMVWEAVLGSGSSLNGGRLMLNMANLSSPSNNSPFPSDLYIRKIEIVGTGVNPFS